VIAPASNNATTARARFEKCIPPPYFPIFPLHRHLDDSERLSEHRWGLG
jgi:hypothetical protein